MDDAIREMYKRALEESIHVRLVVPRDAPRDHQCDDRCRCQRCGGLQKFDPSFGLHVCADEQCREAHYRKPECST